MYYILLCTLKIPFVSRTMRTEGMMEFKTFTLHSFEGQIESLFIAEYDNRLLLMDGGSRSDVERIELFITETLNRPMGDLKLMIVTHAHPDHAGAAPILRKRYGIPIAAPPGVDRWYAGFTGWLQHLIDTALAWFVVLRSKRPYRRMWYARKVRPDILLHENTAIPGFEEWRAIEAPGHTTHDIVLYNESEKLLYASDIILKVKDRCMLPFPVTIPALMEKSLRKLATLKLETVFMAHGERCMKDDPSAGFIEMIDQIYDEKTSHAYRRIQPFTRFSPEVKRFSQE